METLLHRSSKNRFVFIVPSFILIFIGIYWLNSISSENSGQVEDTERSAYDFIGTDLSGNIFNGASLNGKTVLLNFWAVWCAPCIKAFPELNRLNTELNSENFEVIGMTMYSGTVEDVEVITDKHTPNFNILMLDNDEMAIRYNIIGFPTYYLIEPNGGIYKKYVGKIFFDQIKSALEDINSKYDDVAELRGDERIKS